VKDEIESWSTPESAAPAW